MATKTRTKKMLGLVSLFVMALLSLAVVFAKAVQSARIGTEHVVY